MERVAISEMRRAEVMAIRKASLHDSTQRLAIRKGSYEEPMSEFKTIERYQVGYLYSTGGYKLVAPRRK